MADAAIIDAAPPPAPPAAQVVTEPYWKGMFSDTGELNPASIEKLPVDLAGVKPLLGRQKSIDTILRSWEQANALASKKALAPLPANATPEMIAERKTFLDNINGVPKEAKDYGIAKPKDLPDAAWNPKLADSAAKWAHENSVSPQAMAKLIEMQIGSVKEQLSEQQNYATRYWAAEQQTFDATIKRENIPPERAQALVEAGALKLGLNLEDAQTKNFLKGANARLMAMRHAIATGEEKMPTGGGGSEGGGERDPAALANSARTDKTNPLYAPYWNRDGKASREAHEAAVARVNGWLQQAAAKNPPRGRR